MKFKKSALNLKGYLYEKFNLQEDFFEQDYSAIKDILYSIRSRKNEYGRIVYAFFVNLGLAEYGRIPALTDEGDNLLEAMVNFSAEEVAEAEGVAHNGLEF